MPAALTTTHLAIGLLSAAAVALLIWAWMAYRRMELTPIQAPIYVWTYVTARFLWGARVSGPMPVATRQCRSQKRCHSQKQGAVIVCNHRSSIDPAFIAITAKQMVHWMVAKEYCERAVFGWFMRAVEAIPVSRAGVDTAATKMAIRYARAGGLVGVFPEGRINTTDQLLLPGRPGAALIALKARVPVIPCYIAGSPYDGTALGCFLMRAKARLTMGRPIDISEFYGREREREVLEELTRRFLVEIATLAGQPDFQPQLAGRFYKPGPNDD